MRRNGGENHAFRQWNDGQKIVEKNR